MVAWLAPNAFWKDGKEGMLSLGTYPDVPLALARQRRAEMRTAAAEGVDPSANRKATKVARAKARGGGALLRRACRSRGTFEHTARDWFARQRAAWSQGHSKKILAPPVNSTCFHTWAPGR